MPLSTTLLPGVSHRWRASKRRSGMDFVVSVAWEMAPREFKDDGIKSMHDSV